MDGIPRFHRVYDGAVSSDLCRRVIDTFEADEAGQHAGMTLGSSYIKNPDQKKTTDVRVSDRLADPEGKKLWQEIDGELYAAVKATWIAFQQDVPSLKFLSQSVGLADTGYQIQRYEPNVGKFGPHIDAGNISTIFRVAAAVIYFNTVNDGGGTRFPYWGETVDAVEGRILWFPAAWTHVHEGLIPLSGRKYIASTFMCFRGYACLDPEHGEAYKLIMRRLAMEALRRSAPDE